ncbi:TonB-dependent receptor [Phenylobacterium sp. LjRoot219]|uniref:TonB-dependent receptor n=1 Tax=Phenylobacterium sp. LjRoot219 TaxID=3342283 RepID=UPI003ECE1774
MKRSGCGKAVLFCGTALVFATAAHPALAQSQGEPPSSTLQEVVVTAQRRSERLEEVPMSVSVVNNEALEMSNVVSFQDIGRIAVGTQINFSGAFLQPAIRGVSTLTNGNFVENNVSIFVDGFYDPSSTTINADLANVADVQVLKGPQGALYGRNATGGAILINTLGPSTTLTGKFDATYSRFDNKILNGFIAGPISDRLRYSVSGYYRHTPGYLKQISPTTVGEYVDRVGKVSMLATRLKLQADVTDDLVATLGYSYGYNQDNRIAYYSTYAHVGIPTLVPPVRVRRVGEVAFNGEPVQYAIKNQGTLKLAWNTPHGTLTSYTGYGDSVQKNNFDFDGSYADLTFTNIKFRQSTFQQSVDYAINVGEKLDLIVGGLYYRDFIRNSDGQAAPAIFGPNHVLSFNTFSRQVTEAWAVYLDATYQLTDRFSVAAGARYSHDEKSFSTYNRRPDSSVYAVGMADDSWNSFSPRVTARYELAPRTNVYASWSRGFRTGNFSGAAASAGLPVVASEPEKIDAYEIGFKTAQSNFRFETAAFYYDYRDLNVNQVVPIPNCPQGPGLCGVATIFGNAPKAEVYGLDVELTYSPIDNLNLHGGVSLLHARYRNYPNALGTGVNAANTLNVANQIQDWSDKQMARAPEVSGNVGADYTMDLPYGSLLLAANVNFTSNYAINNPSLYGPAAPADLRGKQRFQQGAYALLNGQVTWTHPSENYYVQVFGTNLTDQEYLLNYNGGSPFGDYSAMAEPLSYGVKVGAKF